MFRFDALGQCFTVIFIQGSINVMQQWLTVHLNMTHPQHVIVQRSNRSSTVNLTTDDTQRSHLLIPQGHRDAADLWASVSNYRGYEGEKKQWKVKSHYSSKKIICTVFSRRLKQSNEWAHFCSGFLLPLNVCAAIRSITQSSTYSSSRNGKSIHIYSYIHIFYQP